MKVNPLIFRNYDIRGVAGKELDAKTVNAVARAYGTFLKRKKIHHMVIGRDCRLSGEEYQKALPLFRPEKPPQSLFVNLGRVLKNLKRNKEAIDALYRAKKYGKPTLEIALLLAELFLEIKESLK